MHSKRVLCGLEVPDSRAWRMAEPDIVSRVGVTVAV